MRDDQRETMRRVHGYFVKEHMPIEALAVRDTIDDASMLAPPDARVVVEMRLLVDAAPAGQWRTSAIEWLENVAARLRMQAAIAARTNKETP